MTPGHPIAVEILSKHYSMSFSPGSNTECDQNVTLTAGFRGKSSEMARKTACAQVTHDRVQNLLADMSSLLTKTAHLVCIPLCLDIYMFPGQQ
jgi:hypothetical protein